MRLEPLLMTVDGRPDFLARDGRRGQAWYRPVCEFTPVLKAG